MPRSSRESTRARTYRWAQLPYGYWRCADGREVLFNRHYQPLYQRHIFDEIAWPARRNEEVRHIEEHWFYDDGTIPTAARLEAILLAFGGGEDMRPWFHR